MHQKSLILFLLLFLFGCDSKPDNSNYNPTKAGDVLDEFNGVKIYYNQSFSNVSGRNQTEDGYNLGLKYQCVEFVKRYYYEFYNHRMPNTWGHAKNFFNKQLADGQFNPDRGLIQYTNGSKTKPAIGDLIVFDGGVFNSFGHVVIVSEVKNDEIEVVQQNCGMNSRQTYALENTNNRYKVKADVLGWLRMRTNQ